MNSTELVMLNSEQHQSLSTQKENIESMFNVKIHIPISLDVSVSANEIICVTFSGDTKQVRKATDYVQKFHMEEPEAVLIHDKSIPLVTLSDSDDIEIINILPETVSLKKKRKRKRNKWKCLQVKIPCINGKTQNNFAKLNEGNVLKKQRLEITKQSDFIPICSIDDGKKKSQTAFKNSKTSEVKVPKKVIVDPARLRPVAIDGSNVARSHGKKTNSFSCKGILLSVKFFLDRGHTRVTAFVPRFRRHCKSNHLKTTDQDILEELETAGYLAFTPSRHLEGKSIVYYDDRFIVEYASKVNGVILSNDNYRDLKSESVEFKKTIEERLLMYCFVEDILMVGNDPLGKGGPNLDEFLSFPLEDKSENT